METIPDIVKLRYYREEVKHEFSLLAMRSNILVTCQYFLSDPDHPLQEGSKKGQKTIQLEK